jgi:hypothetical protein
MLAKTFFTREVAMKFVQFSPTKRGFPVLLQMPLCSYLFLALKIGTKKLYKVLFLTASSYP